MVELHRSIQAMAMILERHLDRLENLDKNLEKTKDGVQRVEEMVRELSTA